MLNVFFEFFFKFSGTWALISIIPPLLQLHLNYVDYKEDGVDKSYNKNMLKLLMFVIGFLAFIGLIGK